MATSAGNKVQTRQQKGRAGKKKAPERAISARLEHVRGRFGYKSRRAFWQALCDGWDDPVSYEAVRMYHWKRQPPPSYLARVAEVFGVRLEWLITGEGRITEAEEEAARGAPLDAIPGRVYPPIDRLQRYAMSALLSAWSAIAEGQPGPLGQVMDDGSGRTLSGHTWHELQLAVLAPLHKLEDFFGPAVDSDADALSDYAAAVALALRRYARTVVDRTAQEEGG
jgi:hypothetical protein